VVCSSDEVGPKPMQMPAWMQGFVSRRWAGCNSNQFSTGGSLAGASPCAIMAAKARRLFLVRSEARAHLGTPRRTSRSVKFGRREADCIFHCCYWLAEAVTLTDLTKVMKLRIGKLQPSPPLADKSFGETAKSCVECVWYENMPTSTRVEVATFHPNSLLLQLASR